MYNLNGKKILVTGGAGFVGSTVVKSSIKNYNAEVTVLDDLFSGNLKHLEDLQFEFINGTVEDLDLLEEVIREKNVIFHLAARNIIVSNKNPREDFDVNVKGSFNVFEKALKHNVERTVYTSTSSIYGNPVHMPISEDDKKSF